MKKINRIDRLHRQMKDMGLTQILITDPIAIYYLTGKLIEPMERLLALYVEAGKNPILFLNELFFCPEDLGVTKVWMTDNDDGPLLISQYTNRSEALGVDKNIPAKFLLPLMKYQAAADYVEASEAVDALRAVKDADEQELMRRSSAINDSAMNEIRRMICEGMTERELAEMLPAIYKRLGAERGAGMACFGKNAADPHHKSDDTVLRYGDAVLLDISGSYHGYRSDMTRTFFYGAASKQHQEIYDIVLRANRKAEEAVCPGVRFDELDEIARGLIRREGYGDCFIHRLGHFAGLQVHEAGDVSASNHGIAVSGMIFSIEPGIYIVDDVGVRIEDLVMVTETGCEVLNKYPKQIEILCRV